MTGASVVTTSTTMPGPQIAGEFFAVPLEPYRYLLYAPEMGVAFVGTARLVNRIADMCSSVSKSRSCLDPELSALLQSLGIRDADDEEAEARIALELRLRSGNVVMTDQTALEALDSTFSSTVAGRRARLRYVGMEGCADAWHVLEYSLAHTRARLGEDARGLEVIGVVTGVLGPEETARMSACVDAVEVCADVLPGVESRPNLPALQRFPVDWLEMLRLLNAAGCPTSLRIPVTLAHLHDLTESLHYLCEIGGFEEIVLEPSMRWGCWNGTPESETLAMLEAFRAAQRALAPLHCSIRMAGTQPGSRESFCGAPVEQLAVLPNGSTSQCCGSFEHYCDGCFARGDCAGPCQTAEPRDVAFQGSQRCHLIRELLKDRIVAGIARSGVSW